MRNQFGLAEEFPAIFVFSCRPPCIVYKVVYKVRWAIHADSALFGRGSDGFDDSERAIGLARFFSSRR